MRLRRTAALAAITVLTVLPVVGSQALASGPNAAAARAAAEHQRIVAFWTPERMRAAGSRDVRFDSVRGYHIAPQAKPGGGGGGGRDTTGASWPNGRGKVYKAT